MEQPPQPKREMSLEEFFELATELCKESGFRFRGITDETYARMKADEEEYPGFATPIDELLRRFDEHGFKLVMADDPQSPNIFAVPADSTDTASDSVLLRTLKIQDGMNPRIVKLIKEGQRLFDAGKK